MITATNLSKSYGARVLFSDCHLQLDRGQRVGIVGANGSGKSTLLRLLTGEEDSSSGDVNKVGAARIGVLEQDWFSVEDERVLDVTMMGDAELWSAMQEKEAMLADDSEFDVDRFGDLEDTIQRLDGYGAEARAAEILVGLGIPTEKHLLKLSALSGGYKLRALLARTLASLPDILLLDEPTNHLDILAIAWLERFLATFSGLVVVVSHDHRFLDAICTHILDVDYERVISYKGNYTAFVQRKAEERARLEIEIARRKKEIDEHKAFVARFKAKATKARQANSRQKRLEKIEIKPLPQSSRRHPLFKLKVRRPSGRQVLEVKQLTKAYGDHIVLMDVDFTVHRGERVAIIGANGVGKSTLLKILVEELDADTGTAEWGYEADYGYFPQDHADVLGDPTASVSSSLWDVIPMEPIGAIFGKLAEVLFSREDADKEVGHLSGGEGARLLFARLAARKSTVLVLDEPTNHLDLEGIESLANGLEAYDGTVLFVSHDRWFVDKLATRVIEIKEDGIDDFSGTYAEFLARTAAADHLDQAAVVAAASRNRKKGKKGKKGKPAEAPVAAAPNRRRKKGKKNKGRPAQR
jgi:ATPase subunit of ABC transporter with duplicated ATPase domains